MALSFIAIAFVGHIKDNPWALSQAVMASSLFNITGGRAPSQRRTGVHLLLWHGSRSYFRGGR